MRLFRVLLLAASVLEIGHAQRVGSPTDDLSNLSVDELFSVQVSSVGRKAQQLSKAPAAVFVLSAEDIRRSGATSIPEALEWVPGLSVFRLDGRSWAISARGGARLFANQILVMIDGRSLFTPLFSGVVWDTIDVSLEDIEQIEVVRGPGAVMWGPNAVNGVINIITKSARATKGGRFTVASGNELRGAVEARWGARLGDRLAFRGWGKLESRAPAYGSPGYFDFTPIRYRDPSIANLDWRSGRAGFRMDAQLNEKDQWMLEGDIFKMGRQDALGYPVLLPDFLDRQQGHSGAEGSSLFSRWTHSSATGGETVFQFSWDRSDIDYPFVGTKLTNVTADFQNRRPAGEHHEIYWGAGFQQYWDDTYSSRFFGLDPRGARFCDGDLVLRDEWQMVPEKLAVSAGIRLDYSTYRRLEYQPSLRLLYTPSKRQSFWLAASRAVRVPNHGDRAEQYDGGYELDEGIPFPVHIEAVGSSNLRSEVERSIEAGYRFQSGQHWSFDISAFRSLYGRLVSMSGPAVPQLSFRDGVPFLDELFVMENAGAGVSQGGEAWVTWQVRPRWRLMPSYAYVVDQRRLPDSAERSFVWNYSPSDLRHQGWLRLEHDLSRSWQVDVMARARSRDLGLDLPGAVLVDAHVSYRATRTTEFSFAVNNLTGRSVLEGYSELAFPSIPVRRTFVVKWSQRF